MSDESGTAGDGDGADPASDEAAAASADRDAETTTPMPGLSDDGILMFFAAAACLLSAAVGVTTDLPVSVAVIAAAGGVPAGVAFVADVRSAFVPGSRLELLVGGAAVIGALLAVPGRYYVTIGTLLAAAALVLWRVFDVEVRDAER